MANARTIRKVLMADRPSTFWGRRAFVKVRLPLNLAEEPIPEFTPPPGKEVSQGCWKEVLPNGEVKYTDISKLFGTYDPREATEPGDPAPHFIKEDPGFADFEWWEGVVYYSNQEDFEELPKEYIGQWKARIEWFQRYAEGWGQKVHPVLNAFHRAGWHAKTWYHSVTEDHKYLYLEYSVKWFYPERKLRFCADLHKAFRIARQHNVKVKLMR